MSEQDDRKIAASIIRGAGAAAQVTAGAVGDPMVKGVATATGVLFELVAGLVEKLGVGKAEEVLKDLAANPAKPITEAELAAQVARIKAEFGVGEPEFTDPTEEPPANPFDDDNKP